jgi:hypothetical protein
LKTLCTRWGATEEDLEALKFYLKGAEWDYSDDVRIVAMSIAGEYLRLDGFDPELLALLLESLNILVNLMLWKSIRITKEHFSRQQPMRQLLEQWEKNMMKFQITMKSKEL